MMMTGASATVGVELWEASAGGDQTKSFDLLTA
jgi:hypothetical protein